MNVLLMFIHTYSPGQSGLSTVLKKDVHSFETQTFSFAPQVTQYRLPSKSKNAGKSFLLLMTSVISPFTRKTV